MPNRPLPDHGECFTTARKLPLPMAQRMPYREAVGFFRYGGKSKMKGSRLLFVALAVVFAVGLAVGPAALWAAESDTGSIDGNVFDETRAAVPGATVTAKNVATGLTRTAIASASGGFHI